MKNTPDKIWLESILEHLEMIESFTSSLTYEEFLNDMRTKLACEKCIQNISESSIHLSQQFKIENTGFPWKEIKGMRNIIVHEYFQIDYAVVWDVIQNFVPKLKTQIQNVLKEYLL